MESTLAELREAIGECTINNQLGSIFSTCLLGALTAIEVIKQMLNIGTTAGNPLSFDLLTMSFENQDKNTPAASRFFKLKGAADRCKSISADGLEYIEEIPKSLAGRKALIVGTGGLGSPAAYALVRAGIGTIGLVDYDTVDISNLNRQILHSTSRLGFPKVDSAEIFLHQLNPDVTIVKHNIGFNAENAIEIIHGYDVIIDGVDNFPARYLLNDACFLTQKPMIEAGVSGFDGMGMTINPGRSMCYRCLFPQMPAAGTIPSCSETGVLGPVPGVLGFIEACEAAKLLTGQGRLLTDTLLAFDALELSFEVLRTGKNKTCPLCGINPTITQLQTYKWECQG
jgi:molybdopterin/thiamine biosynthesis adenylyltransferase